MICDIIYSTHGCALFENGRVICWGSALSGDNLGQLGTVFGTYQGVGNCALPCVKVSSATFIAFADTLSIVSKVSAGTEHTCVLFSQKTRVICFGNASKGQTGYDTTSKVAGSAGPLLGSQGYISFSDNIIPIRSISAGFENTCILRCNGRVICFGSNSSGQLGQMLLAANHQGDGSNEVSALNPIGFSSATIAAAFTGAPYFTALTLNPETVVSIGGDTCQRFFIVNMIDTYVASVKSFTSSIGSTISVNDGPATTVMKLVPDAPNFMYIRLISTGTGYSTLYTIIIRRVSSYSVYLGQSSTCLQTSNRVACWGVYFII